jgi:hypothetical protein
MTRIATERIRPKSLSSVLSVSSVVFGFGLQVKPFRGESQKGDHGPGHRPRTQVLSETFLQSRCGLTEALVAVPSTWLGLRL